MLAFCFVFFNEAVDLNNINESTVPHHPFANCVSQPDSCETSDLKVTPLQTRSVSLRWYYKLQVKQKLFVTQLNSVFELPSVDGQWKCWTYVVQHSDHMLKCDKDF